MRIGVVLSAVFLALSALGSSAGSAQASPWAEVGDNQLRSDIQLLAAAGVVDDVTTHWPLPWYAVIAGIDAAALDAMPLSVRLAAARVLTRARAETADGTSASLYLDMTNKPSLVYGFDGMGRGKGQTQLSVSGTSGDFSGRLSLGAFSQDLTGKTTKIMPEGTYMSARLGDALIYAGYLDHWWGPGQISALSFSNNARPMPQVGIQRADTSASSWPVVRWLGPWQFEFLLGYLDGPRIQPDTYYAAFRFTFSPSFLPGLEIGLARTEQFCGEGHPCVPLRDYFHFSNNPLSTNATNDEGLMDFKYSGKIGELPFQTYVQFMNEDYSPVKYSGTSHLVGASVFLPTWENPVKLTVEYASSVATRDIFSFGTYRYGFSYNNYSFLDGMRYRGRTLGFSLDSDSTLLSLQGSWTDQDDRFFQLSVHQARIGSSRSLGANILSPTPVLVNLAEARVTLPWNGLKLDLAGRVQDDQPRPSRGFAAGIEVALRMNL